MKARIVMTRILTTLAVLVSVGWSAVSAVYSEHLSPSAATHDVSDLLNTTGAGSDASPATYSAADVRRLAREAYVWGWPMAYVRNCHDALLRVPSPGRSGGMPVAPPNELCMLTDYIAPTATVPCPNQDVVYGYGILDLAIEPVVVQVPEFGDRFWVYQLGDQRTDGFAEVGKMYGTKPGVYLIVGPNWNGAAPQGIAGVFRCSTRIGYVVPRVFLDDTAEDRAAVLPIVNQIMAYPLSKFNGDMKTTDWSKVRWLPRVGAMAKAGAKRVEPESFFDLLGEILSDVPPLAGEERSYAEYRELLSLASSNAAVKKLLVETAVATENEVVAPLFEFRNFGRRLPHHWTTIANGAAFGKDYLTRLAVAKSNVFVNRNSETKYFYQDLDAQGLRLDGRRNYRVTFKPGEVPPAKGFWSLTLYNDRHAFHANELNRYSLGTKNKQLKYDADGSLTIYVGPQPPSAELASNWLPTPSGSFSLYLRAYWPEERAIAGLWSPPAVTAESNANGGLLAATAR
jgi:hypothetical protein